MDPIKLPLLTSSVPEQLFYESLQSPTYLFIVSITVCHLCNELTHLTVSLTLIVS